MMEEKILAALAQLNGKFDTMQADVSEMKADISGLKTDVAALQEEQRGMKAQIEGNHALLRAVRGAQEMQRAELDHLKVTTASRKSLDHLKETISTQMIAMGEAVANA